MFWCSITHYLVWQHLMWEHRFEFSLHCFPLSVCLMSSLIFYFIIIFNVYYTGEEIADLWGPLSGMVRIKVEVKRARETILSFPLCLLGTGGTGSAVACCETESVPGDRDGSWCCLKAPCWGTMLLGCYLNSLIALRSYLLCCPRGENIHLRHVGYLSLPLCVRRLRCLL